MNDLTTLLHDDVRRTEPTHGLDPRIPVRLGRRRLRTQRLAAGAAAVLVVASGAAALPHLVPDGTPPVAGQHALVEAVEPVLERSLPGLGEPVRHETAAGTEVVWGDLARQVSVTVASVPGTPDAPVRDEVVVQRVLGTVGPDGAQSYAFADVAPERVGDVDREELFVARRAEVVAGGVRVVVTERVAGTSADGLAVPVADLRALATDPAVSAAH